VGEINESGDRPGTSEELQGAEAAWRNELSGEVLGSAVQAQVVHGDVYLGTPPGAPMPVPRQLPSPPAYFTGRASELVSLRRLAAPEGDARAVTPIVLTGVGGVGKTALAVYWLHQARDGYPDGQLYADLRGSGAGEPVSPADVLARFLRALRVPPDRVPAGLDELVSLYRSMTDGRRVIVLLDNAASAAQVRLLLPGPGPSLVVVTTRRHLAGLALDGVRFTDVLPLDEQAAVELLSRIAGADRAGSQPDAARAVVRLCGLLPLAVCVSAARLAPHPNWPLRRIADELADERDRLSVLSVEGDVSVRAVFDVSYRALPPPAARAYRLLGLIPGPAFGAGLAAAATGTGPAEAVWLLNALTEASLLEEAAEHRWRFHDLVRLHAWEQAATGPAADRQAATARIVEWYLHMAVAADLTVIPGRWHLGSGYEQARREPAAFAGAAEALDWLEAELPGLLAALRLAHDEGMHDKTWQLCEALWGLFVNRRPYQHWAEAHTLGLASARTCGHRRAQARMHIHLGFARLCLGHYDPAREQFTLALALDRAEGHQPGEATALDNLGLASLAAGDPAGALDYFTQARAILEQIGRPRGAALMTRRIGEAHSSAGRHQEAADCLADARRRFAELGDSYNEARTLTSLAESRLHAGQPEDAGPLLRSALATMTRLGSRHQEARLHVLLADTAARLGDTDTEQDHLQRALTAYTAIGASEAGQVRARLAGQPPASGPSKIVPNKKGTPDA
jgi:tetratricopeptide (TPR) repeat protein